MPLAPNKKGRAGGKRKVLGRPPAKGPLEPGYGSRSYGPIWTLRTRCGSEVEFKFSMVRIASYDSYEDTEAT
jgi:hypothetical protein